MAKEEHVAVLKHGVDAWTTWREEDPEVHPHLAKANLCWTDLNWVNLSRVNLNGADLNRANLRSIMR